MKYRLFLSLILVLTSVGVYPQTAVRFSEKPAPDTRDLSHPYRMRLQQADLAFQSEQYTEALKAYLHVGNQYPDNLYAAYQSAECYRYLFQYTQAETLYGKVGYGNTIRYPLGLFYYALMQKMNGKYAEAIRSFDAFVKQASSLPDRELPNHTYWIERSSKEQLGCSQAMQQLKFLQNTVDFRHIGSPVSSPQHDYAPVLFPNDTTILLTSGRTTATSNPVPDKRLGEAFSDFHVFTRASVDTWTEKADPVLALNTAWNEGTGSLTADGKKFYFTSCQGEGIHCAIYVAKLENGRWTKPERLHTSVNKAGSDSRHPTLTPQGDTLYFVSDRKGGLGRNDIWMSVRTGKEKWQPAVNLGKEINTNQNDISPFYYAGGQLLFFASDGHAGLGGLDVYYTTINTDSLPPVVSNMGLPFNSSQDDAFLVISEKKGFLSSNREGGTGNFDLYSFLTYSRQNEVIALNQLAPKGIPDMAYMKDFRLEYLPEAQKIVIDQLTQKNQAQLLYNTPLPLLSQEKNAYEHLSDQEKKKVDDMMQKLNTQIDTATLREQDRIRYETQLSREEKQQLQYLTGLYQQALRDSVPLELSDEDRFYYESLSPEERNALNRQIAALLSGAQQPDESILQDEDAFRYNKLPPEEKQRIERITAARYAALLNAYDEHLKQEDSFYYEQLSAAGKEQLDRLVKARMGQYNHPIDSTLLSTEDATYYTKMAAEEKQRVERMAAARYAADLNATEEEFKSEDAFIYQQLDIMEKERIDRIMVVRMIDDTHKIDLAALSNRDRFAYTQLSEEEKQQIERIAAARYAAEQTSMPEQLKEEDRFFYESLSPEKKDQFDQWIAARMKNIPENIDESELSDNDRFAYEQLSAAEKERLQRLAAVRYATRLNETDATLADEDRLAYEAMSPAERTQTDRLVAAWNASREKQQKEAAVTEDAFHFQALPAVEESPAQLTQHADSQMLTPKDILSRSWISRYQQVSLTGKVVDTRTGKAAANMELPLVNDAGHICKTTSTNPDGTFQYLDLPLKENLRLRIQTPPVFMTQAPSLYLERLELVAYRKASPPSVFEPVYFEFDSYILTDQATEPLDKLIAYYRQNPDIQIELNGFADAAGSDEYNFSLSFKRSLSIQKYLISKGIQPASLAIHARGEMKNRPEEENIRNPAARKVEITIQNPDPESLKEVFIITADTSLEVISQKTSVPVDTLRTLNGFQGDTIEAYRPVRIR